MKRVAKDNIHGRWACQDMSSDRTWDNDKVTCIHFPLCTKQCLYSDKKKFTGKYYHLTYKNTNVFLQFVFCKFVEWCHVSVSQKTEGKFCYP